MHRVRSRGVGPAAMRCDRRSRCIRPDPAFQPGFAAHCLSRWTLCGGGSRIQSESIRYSASPQSRAGASRRDPLSLCRLTPPALHIYMCVCNRETLAEPGTAIQQVRSGVSRTKALSWQGEGQPPSNRCCTKTTTHRTGAYVILRMACRELSCFGTVRSTF